MGGCLRIIRAQRVRRQGKPRIGAALLRRRAIPVGTSSLPDRARHASPSSTRQRCARSNPRPSSRRRCRPPGQATTPRSRRSRDSSVPRPSRAPNSTHFASHSPAPAFYAVLRCSTWNTLPAPARQTNRPTASQTAPHLPPHTQSRPRIRPFFGKLRNHLSKQRGGPGRFLGCPPASGFTGWLERPTATRFAHESGRPLARNTLSAGVFRGSRDAQPNTGNAGVPATRFLQAPEWGKTPRLRRKSDPVGRPNFVSLVGPAGKHRDWPAGVLVEG